MNDEISLKERDPKGVNSHVKVGTCIGLSVCKQTQTNLFHNYRLDGPIHI